MEVEEVKVGVSELSTGKILVTGSETTTGRLREVEREEARDGHEEIVIAVEEVIVLDEGITGVREKEV